MRYGLRFADGDPFPKDITVGVQLQDEPVVVIPDPCPIVAGCAVTFTHWQYWLIGHRDLGGAESGSTLIIVLGGGFGADFGALTGGDGVAVDVSLAGSGQIDLRQPVFLVLVPIIQKCGHRIRFVRTGETVFSAVENSSDPDTLDVEGLTYNGDYNSRTPTHQTMTAKVQIDLTDAAPGAETWTDIGPIVNIKNF